jgi:hypothetical protein
MSGRSRSRTRRVIKLEPLKEEEELVHLVADSYQLALSAYSGPVDRETITSIVKDHMTESVIMSLGSNTPHNSNSVDDAIDTFLSSRDVHSNIIKSRYRSWIAQKRRNNRSRGGRRTTRRKRA